LEFIERFKIHLTAKKIKKDRKLYEISAVRRNFQGTTFELDKFAFDRMKLILKEKNKDC